VHVLVTGGAGYIGSHTAKILAQTGMQPIVLDNLQRGHPEAVKWAANSMTTGFPGLVLARKLWNSPFGTRAWWNLIPPSAELRTDSSRFLEGEARL
jgi:nucleoside-diphosphate-sugar epimerase